MKNKVILPAILALLLAAAGYAYLHPSEKTESLRTYTNNEYGFSFSYPEKYLIEAVESGNGERRLTSVFLIEDTEENRQVLAGQSPGREGPTSVSLDIYQNNLDGLSVEAWIKNTSASNYKLGNGELEAGKIAGLDALSYGWDGLYQGKTSVFEHKGTIYALTTTYMDQADPTLRLVKTVAETLKFNP